MPWNCTRSGCCCCPVACPAYALQADELQELSVLAKDAAEILWEMVAMGEVRCCLCWLARAGSHLLLRLSSR